MSPQPFGHAAKGLCMRLRREHATRQGAHMAGRTRRLHALSANCIFRFRDRTEEGIKRVIPETKPGAKESHRRKSATAMPHTFMAPEPSTAWSAPASPIRFTAVSDAFERERTAFGFRSQPPLSGTPKVTCSVDRKRRFFSLAGLPPPAQSPLSAAFLTFLREPGQFTFGRRSKLFAK